MPITHPTIDRLNEALPTNGRHVTLAHGAGGKATAELLQDAFLPRLGNELLNEMLDAVSLRQGNRRVACTIDTTVVNPLFFPGGDIGRLAVCGAINDLSVCDAKPIALAVAFLLAEGLPRTTLDDVVDSIVSTANEASVRVVAGDTRVVPHDQADQLFLTVCGLGVVPRHARLHPGHVMPGDVLIATGPIAEHGLAVLLARQGPKDPIPLRSDLRPLHNMIELLLKRVPGVVFMRDPARGGIARVCTDLAARTGWRVRLEESEIPLRPEAARAAEFFGIDPLEVPCGGIVVLVVRPTNVQQAISVLHSTPEGALAAPIGQIEAIRDGECELHLGPGGKRTVQMPIGAPVLTRTW